MKDSHFRKSAIDIIRITQFSSYDIDKNGAVQPTSCQLHTTPQLRI